MEIWAEKLARNGLKPSQLVARENSPEHNQREAIKQT